ncbi:MAG: M28 family peptidase, partial [bacterium]
IVLFDGEDSGEAGRVHSFCLGSAYYVEHMVTPKPTYGVLVDMVGDSNLDIYIEQNSMALAPRVVELILQSAQGSSSFHTSVRHSIHDDHMNLIESGIPCAAIIDFDYQYWHTLQDTPEKCSARSLKTVGEVLLRIAYR